MSQAALMIATRDYIKQNIQIRGNVLGELWCEITETGKPIGQSNYFIGIHSGGWTQSSVEVLDEMHTIHITYSIKTGDVPTDKLGVERIVKEQFGLEEVVRLLANRIHNNRHIVVAANNLINEMSPALYGDNVEIRNGFVEPLRVASISPARTVGTDWWDGKGGEGRAGLVQSITFNRARLVAYALDQPVIDALDVFPEY